MALADLDARDPQQHRGLALVRGVGPVDLELGHEDRDAMRFRERRHYRRLRSSPLRSRRAPWRSSCAIVCTRHTVAVHVVVGAGERPADEPRAGRLDRRRRSCALSSCLNSPARYTVEPGRPRPSRRTTASIGSSDGASGSASNGAGFAQRDHAVDAAGERRDRGARASGACSISHCSCGPGNVGQLVVVDDLRRRQILGEDPLGQIRAARAIARERAREHELRRVQPRGRGELERRERPAPDRELQRAEIRALQRLRRGGELLDAPAPREIVEVEIAHEPLRLGMRRDELARARRIARAAHHPAPQRVEVRLGVARELRQRAEIVGGRAHRAARSASGITAVDARDAQAAHRRHDAAIARGATSRAGASRSANCMPRSASSSRPSLRLAARA